MRILIVEDEPPIARHIEGCCRKILGSKIQPIHVLHSLKEAADFLKKQSIDLCLLDLNLKGKSGYDLLKRAVAGSFHTIIISAYTDQAVEAFKYGVLDFVPKPVKLDRLQEAFSRFEGKQENRELQTKYLVVRHRHENRLLPVDNVICFRAAGNYVEACLKDGSSEFLDKSMDRLEQIAPPRFFRAHRSYLVDLDTIVSFKHAGGGAYEIQLKNGNTIPLSRHRVKGLRELIDR